METEDGLHGWGEAYVTRGKEKVIEECLRCMAPWVIGRSSFIELAISPCRGAPYGDDEPTGTKTWRDS